MDDFEIIHQLGKGSFSLVLVAKRKEDNKTYAIKRVQISNMSEKEKLNALNEVRLLSLINHQNIIGYKESFYDDSSQTLNIVLEYADGGDLRSKIQSHLHSKRIFKENEIWGILIQLLTGLRYLHAHNIIHRDLKTANIFLTKTNIYKLGDLNVSKIAKSGLLYTQTGTPFYASPEIWEEKPYDTKTDMWSIGCIAYEMCCLCPPFKGKNLSVVYHNIIRGKYEKMPSIYSKELISMVESLLKVNPRERPSCEEILRSAVVRKKIYSIYGNIGDEEEKNTARSRNGGEGGCGRWKTKELERVFLDGVRIHDGEEIKEVLPKGKRYSVNNDRHLRCTTGNVKVKGNRTVIEMEVNIKENTNNVFKRNRSLTRCNVMNQDADNNNNKPRLENLICEYKSKGSINEDNIHIPISCNSNIEHINVLRNRNTPSRSHTPNGNVLPISCQTLRNVNASKINQILSHQGRNIRIHSNSLSKFDNFKEEYKEDENHTNAKTINFTKNQIRPPTCNKSEMKQEETKQSLNNRKSFDYPKPPKPHLSGKAQPIPNRKESFNYPNKNALKLTINPLQILDNPNIRKILSTHLQNKLPVNRHFTSNSTVNTSESNTPRSNKKK